MVDQDFSQLNENAINNQDPHSHIETDETTGVEYPNDNDSEEKETNRTSVILNLMPT